MKYVIEPTKGIAPRVAKDKLASGFGVKALRCYQGAGTLRPFNGIEVELAGPFSAKSIYLWGRSQGGSGTWLTSGNDVDYVRGTVPNDTKERTYYTGVSYPRMTYADIINTTSYKLGLPSPAAPDGLSVQGAIPAEETDPEINTTSRVYVVTYVSELGEEGPPSSPSDKVDVHTSQYVAINILPGAPTGNYNVTHKRIYRSAIDDTGSAGFFFVAQVPVAQIGYSDSVDDENLGEELSSTDYSMPPADGKGLISLPNGVMAMFAGNTVYLSEPNLPHAWPSDYEYSVDHDIIGMGYFDSTIVVLTQEYPYILSGVHPAQMSLDKLTIPQGCVSKRSVFSSGNHVYYISPDGVMRVGSDGFALLTANNFDKETWGAYDWSEALTTYHDGRLYVFHSTGGFAFSPDNPLETMVELSDTADAAFRDTLTDTLYLAQGSVVYKWNTDEANKPDYEWRSGDIKSLHKQLLPYCRINGPEAGTVTLTVWLDDVQAFSDTVSLNTDIFIKRDRFTSMRFEFIGKTEISNITFASTKTELR